jgi:hypothetical protein
MHCSLYHKGKTQGADITGYKKAPLAEAVEKLAAA